MAGSKQDPSQDQELPPLPAKGVSMSSPTFEDGFAFGIALSPPPKSPLRGLVKTTTSMATTTRTTTAAQRRKSSQKVHQLTGIDIDVFDDSPWKYGNFQTDTASDTSSVYSQDSVNNATMKSWQTTTDELPPLENDQDVQSSRVDSWESRPPVLFGTRASLPSLAQTTLPANRTGPLTRKPRTKRKSRDQPMDNYHRIVTDIASPTVSRASVADIPTAIHHSQQTNNNSLRNTQSCYGLASSLPTSNMPPDFGYILTSPRQAPRPPLAQPGLNGERLGSFFDFDSDSDEDDDGAFSTSGRGRDSFLGMLLGRGSVEDERRSRSVSRGAVRPISSSEALDANARKTEEVAKSAAVVAPTGGKRAALKGLVERAKRDKGVTDGEKRRQELKQKIMVTGGRRL